MTAQSQNPTTSSAIKLSIASFLSLIGSGLAMYLSQLYYRVRTGEGGFQTFCNLGEGMNCDVAAGSKWAELFPGLPLSSVVAGWFLALFIMTLLARVGDWRKDVARMGAWMSGIGLLYGAFLIYIMFGILKSVCIFCLAIDAVNLLLLVIFLSMKEGPLFGSVTASRLKSSLILTGASILVVTVLLRPVTQNEVPSDQINLLADSVLSAPVENVPVPPSAPVLGNPSAPITIVEFSDFQCPYCARAAVTLNTLLSRYPNQIRVVFRNFPLDPSCNREMKNSLHAHACALARAATCAQKAGKFKPIYEGIFDSQASLGPTSAVDIPVSKGMSEAEIRACLDSEETKSLVGRDIEDAIALKIQSTPTIYVNGRKMNGAYPLEVWDRVIQALSK